MTHTYIHHETGWVCRTGGPLDNPSFIRVPESVLRRACIEPIRRSLRRESSLV